MQRDCGGINLELRVFTMEQFYLSFAVTEVNEILAASLLALYGGTGKI